MAAGAKLKLNFMELVVTVTKHNRAQTGPQSSLNTPWGLRADTPLRNIRLPDALNRLSALLQICTASRTSPPAS